MPTTSSHSLPYPESTDPADVPADIAALAEAVDGKLDAIAPGQITGPTSGQILIANASGVVTGTSVTGDVTISNAGVTAIGAGAVGTTEIANSAVTTAKLDDASVTGAKLAASTTGSATSYASGSTGTISARKYADGQVVLSGRVVYDSFPGYVTALTVDTIGFLGVALGTLPSGFRPSAGIITAATAPVTGGLIFPTVVAISTGGVMVARVADPNSTSNPLRWYVDGITFHAA